MQAAEQRLAAKPAEARVWKGVSVNVNRDPREELTQAALQAVWHTDSAVPFRLPQVRLSIAAKVGTAEGTVVAAAVPAASSAIAMSLASAIALAIGPKSNPV